MCHSANQWQNHVHLCKCPVRASKTSGPKRTGDLGAAHSILQKMKKEI